MSSSCTPLGRCSRGLCLTAYCGGRESLLVGDETRSRFFSRSVARWPNETLHFQFTACSLQEKCKARAGGGGTGGGGEVARGGVGGGWRTRRRRLALAQISALAEMALVVASGGRGGGDEGGGGTGGGGDGGAGVRSRVAATTRRYGPTVAEGPLREVARRQRTAGASPPVRTRLRPVLAGRGT